MDLSNDKAERDRIWVEQSMSDPWFPIYRSAYERWEEYKNTDPDRAAREYESMLVAVSKGTWWKKWT